MKLHVFFLILVAFAALVVGCKKDDNPVNPGGGGSTTTISATLAGNASGTPQSGRLSLSFPTAKLSAIAGDTATISGYLYMSTGDTVLLSGYYVRTTGYIYVTGGGFTISGTITDGHLSAVYSGPGGASGSVEGGTSGGGHTIVIYRGEYQDTVGGTNHGTFNMASDNGALTVVTSDGGRYYGSISGTAITIYIEGTSGTVLATGHVEGTHVYGSYNAGTTAGTWQGDVWE